MPPVSAYCVKCKGKKITKILGVLVVGNRYSVKGTCPTCESKQCVFVKKKLGDEIGKEYKFLKEPSKPKLTKKAVKESKEAPKKTKKAITDFYFKLAEFNSDLKKFYDESQQFQLDLSKMRKNKF